MGTLFTNDYDPAVMQTLELAGVFALVGIAMFLMRTHFANLDQAPLPFRLAVGFGAGALIGLFMLVRGTDVLPDNLEALAVMVLLAAVVVAVIVLVRRERR